MLDRILYLDAIKAILMFLVIWGHVIQYTNGVEGINNDIALIIYSFHMPMFMAVSGIFYDRILSREIKMVLKSKSIQLLLPSTVILLLLFLMVFINKPRGLQESIVWLWHSRPWFVYTLFICTITSFLGYKVTKSVRMGFLIAFCLFLVVPDISGKELFMLPFFMLGFYWNKYKSVIEKYENLLLFLSFLTFLMLYLLYFNRGV